MNLIKNLRFRTHQPFFILIFLWRKDFSIRPFHWLFPSVGQASCFLILFWGFLSRRFITSRIRIIGLVVGAGRVFSCIKTNFREDKAVVPVVPFFLYQVFLKPILAFIPIRSISFFIFLGLMRLKQPLPADDSTSFSCWHWSWCFS